MVVIVSGIVIAQVNDSAEALALLFLIARSLLAFVAWGATLILSGRTRFMPKSWRCVWLLGT